jgi:hypothetical protein
VHFVLPKPVSTVYKPPLIFFSLQNTVPLYLSGLEESKNFFLHILNTVCVFSEFIIIQTYEENLQKVFKRKWSIHKNFFATFSQYAIKLSISRKSFYQKTKKNLDLGPSIELNEKKYHLTLLSF